MNKWHTNPLPDMEIQAHHVAALIVLGAVAFLVLVDYGLGSLKIDIG